MTFISRKLQFLALRITGLLLLATPCTAAVVPAGVQLHAKQEFVRNNGSEPETLDPALIESVGANQITRDLFEGLTATRSDGETVAGAAESWRATGATTWVFKLRSNGRYSNGDPVTADDFVYAWRRYLDPKTASQNASTYGAFLFNGLKVNEGKLPVTELGVRALDRYTLEVRTSRPVSFLPEVLSNPEFAPVHRKTIERFGKDWTKPGNLVGNGAFALKDWQVNSKVVVEKNLNYWDAGAVVLSRVTYLAVEDGNADVKLFQSGENDMVYQLPPGSYESFRKSNPRDIRNGPMLGLRFNILNVKDPVLQDLRVRKALSMVIDREILAARLTADGQIPAYGIVVKGLNGADVTRYEWADWPMARKVAQARSLLSEAGVKPGSRIRFSYNTSEYHKRMAIFMASEWKTKLGLETEFDTMEFKVLIKKRHDGDFQIARGGWVAPYNDVTAFLTLIQCDSDANDSKVCNRQGETLMEQGISASDPQRRRALLTQAAQVIMDD